jgi:hypothetical protein
LALVEAAANGEPATVTARRLHYAYDTLRWVRVEMFKRLGVSGRHAMTVVVARAVRAGLVTPKRGRRFEHVNRRPQTFKTTEPEVRERLARLGIDIERSYEDFQLSIRVDGPPSALARVLGLDKG